MQRSFANGAHVPGFLRFPASLSEEQYRQLEEQLDDFRGADNAGSLPIFAGSSGGGMAEYVKMGMTMREAEILGTRRMMIEDIARLFRVPPHLLGHMDQMTRSNMETQGREFLTFTLQPWLTAWEQRLDMSLLKESDIENGYYFRFETGALVRADIGTRYAAYNQALQAGWVTPNEVRRLEDLPMVDGGDELYRPLNMGAMDSEVSDNDDNISD
jgi:HK97 family phage portal protein